MNIREWYGFNKEYKANKDIDHCVDGLLELYSKAIMIYFSVKDAKNFQVILGIEKEELNKGQALFLDWLEEKGFPYLQDLASMSLPNDEQLVAKIEYDKYILEEEMDCEFPDDLRSSLIGIVNDVPDYIKSAREVSATASVDGMEFWDSCSTYQSEPMTYGWDTTNFQNTFYRIKGNSLTMSNYKESAVEAGSLFF